MRSVSSHVDRNPDGHALLERRRGSDVGRCELGYGVSAVEVAAEREGAEADERRLVMEAPEESSEWIALGWTCSPHRRGSIDEEELAS